MKILFTKKTDEKLLSIYLNKNIESRFLEVLDFKIRKVQPFLLENKSLIFTSVNGVEAFFKNQFQPHENCTKRPYNKIYCVGTKTRLKIKEYGFGVFKTLKNANLLCDFIIENSCDEKFLHFCGNLALDILNEKLPLQNINYKKQICYDTELLYPLADENYDAIVFFSPSGVRSFAKNNSLEDSTLFSIGETTSSELKKLTKNTIITSKEQTLKSLLSLINNKFKANIA